MGVPPPPPPGLPPPPPPPPGPSGPPAWPFIVGGVVAVAIAVAAVFVFLDPFGGDDGDEDGSVPEGAVAVVGDEEISRDEFDHWLVSAARGQESGADAELPPDPPEFERCIRDKEVAGSNESRDALEDQCRNEYEGLRDQVMQFLISAEWIELEAEERGIEVSDDEVRRQFEDQKDQSFQKESDFQDFLRTSGQTEADLLFRVRLDIFSQRVRDEVIRESDEPDQEALDKFVEEFNQRYRDMTECAEGFIIDQCSNGPPLKDETTTPTPTTPGG